MLATLRECPGDGTIWLSPEFKKDLQWFQLYASASNGVSIIDEDAHQVVEIYVGDCTTECWAKTLLCMGNTPLLPIPAIQGHQANPVAAYRQLLQVSSTLTANQPFITLANNGRLQTVTIPTLAKALCLMLHALAMDSGLYSLHSLHRGGAMAAYRAGANQLDIKCIGT